MEASESKQFYLNQFADLKRRLAGNGASWSGPIREAALARFAELGFPTTRDEEWKYTNVAPFVRIPFKLAGNQIDGAVTEGLRRLDVEEFCPNRLVFVNGRYAAKLSSVAGLPAEVEIRPLGEALSDGAESLKRHLGRYADYQSRSFIALNTALMQDGALLFVPEGKRVEEPLHLVFVSAPGKEATVSYPRNLIVMERESQAAVVESYIGWGDSPYFTNAVTEIMIGENAILDHYKLEAEGGAAFHIAAVQARVERGGNYFSHALALGGALVRNEANVELNGEGGECALDGLYLAAGRQHVDNQTRIDHIKAHCTSRELYKGILGGASRGVFNGKIYVHKAAEKSDARQTNKNLLLSENAWVDTKPQLEIFNNDVKCTHGSTIGQLDESMLFYLRSRGLPRDEARMLLTQGFANEVVQRVKIASLRSRLDGWLSEKLQGTS